MRKTSNNIIKEIDGVLTCTTPAKALPVIFDSPHSGTAYHAEFDYSCDFNDLQRAEDKFVDELFACAPHHGASLLCAHFPRSFIDVNRASDDIDEELLNAPWPKDAPPINPTNRSYAGIGLIRRLISPGVPVYDRDLLPIEIIERIAKYYTPYHETLKGLIDTAHYNFGKSWHINCHSMPTPKSIATFGRINPAQEPDFVLGDRNGTSCDLDFTHAIRDFLKEKGYKVAINDPYKGVELVDRYSAPAKGRHSLQIEISRALYMDEENCTKNNNFNGLKDDMTTLIQFCAAYAQSNLTQQAAD